MGVYSGIGPAPGCSQIVGSDSLPSTPTFRQCYVTPSGMYVCLSDGNWTLLDAGPDTGMVTGGGTTNRLTKWINGAGSVIGDSALLDDGVTVTSIRPIVATNFTDSALTAGRVTYAGTAGILSDDSGFTYNSGTHALTATTFVGALTGIASGNTLVSVVPNTLPSAGQILAGNAGGTAYAPVSMSGDATLASTGALTLASTISAAGPIGSATVAPIITYDAKGRLTTVTSATITPAVGSITGLGTGVATALAIAVNTTGGFDTINGTATLTNKTLTSPVIADIAPGADFTITQNSVVPFKSENSGAIVDTLHLKAGKVGIGSSNPTYALTLTKNGSSLTGTALINAQFIDGTAAHGVSLGYDLTRHTGVILADTGSAASGIDFYTFTGAAFVNQMALGSGGTLTLTSGITNAAGTPGSLCYNTSTFEVTKNNALTCTVSASEYKTAIAPLTDGLDVLLRMNPSQFAYKDDPKRMRWGFVADELQAVNSKLADGYDTKGNAKSIDLAAIMAVITKATQEMYDLVGILDKRILVLSGGIN